MMIACVLRLERIAPDASDWQEMDAFPDRVIFQTQQWLRFVADTQGAEPVVARLHDDGARVGFFTGLVVRRLGIRILGSPFPGWTTSTMGFNLAPQVSRRAAVEALVPFAYRELGCLHLELKDRLLTLGDLDGLGFRTSPFTIFEIDLAKPEDEIFAAMSSPCRRAIRRGAKVGVTVEEADGEDFAEEYYAQLEDVFAKQSLTPSYGVDRVESLIRSIHPTGRLLLLRARGPDGEGIATGIFPAMNGVAYFWGGASWRSHQVARPNEAIFWHAMRYWKERGMSTLDMGGGGDYKRKYGPRELSIPFARRARLPGLIQLRDLAERVLSRGSR
jgi:hypothetical protein